MNSFSIQNINHLDSHSFHVVIILNLPQYLLDCLNYISSLHITGLYSGDEIDL